MDRSYIDDYGTRLVAQGKSPGTVRNYVRAVGYLADSLESRGKDWDTARQIDCEAWLAGMASRGVTPSYRNQCLAGCKGFFKFLEDELWRDGQVSPMRKMKSARVRARVPSFMPDEVLAWVIAACADEKDRFLRARDEALIRFLLDTGLRRTECAELELDAVNLATRRVRVVGKGGKERHVAFGVRTKMAIQRYLRERKEHPSASSKRLWLGRRGDLSAQTVYEIVARRGVRGDAHLYPHRLRRSWAVRAEVDVIDLMALGGWDSPEMARRYKSESEAERAAANYSRNSVGDRF